MTYRVTIDLTRCIGSSNCAEDAPDAFVVDDRGLARLLPGATDAAALRGARACPVEAIVVQTANGESIHP